MADSFSAYRIQAVRRQRSTVELRTEPTIYYKGRFVGKCKSLETFQGYRVYKNDKEAKENEEVK